MKALLTLSLLTLPVTALAAATAPPTTAPSSSPIPANVQPKVPAQVVIVTTGERAQVIYAGLKKLPGEIADPVLADLGTAYQQALQAEKAKAAALAQGKRP